MYSLTLYLGTCTARLQIGTVQSFLGQSATPTPFASLRPIPQQKQQVLFTRRPWGTSFDHPFRFLIQPLTKLLLSVYLPDSPAQPALIDLRPSQCRSQPRPEAEATSCAADNLHHTRVVDRAQCSWIRKLDNVSTHNTQPFCSFL